MHNFNLHACLNASSDWMHSSETRTEYLHYNNNYIVGPGATGCVFDLNKAQSQLQDQINNGLCGCNGSGKGTIKGTLT